MKTKFKLKDKVRIINPEFLIRCGYNETVDSAMEKMEKSFQETHDGETLTSFLLEHFPYLDEGCEFKNLYNRSLNTIKWELAKNYNRTVLGFGGSERKIFTQRIDEFKDQVFTIVDGPKIHKTGIYHPGYESYDYYNGGVEYSPAFLGNAKTHVFYAINYYQNMGGVLEYQSQYWIEKINIEKIEEK